MITDLFQVPIYLVYMMIMYLHCIHWPTSMLILYISVRTSSLSNSLSLQTDLSYLSLGAGITNCHWRPVETSAESPRIPWTIWWTLWWWPGFGVKLGDRKQPACVRCQHLMSNEHNKYHSYCQCHSVSTLSTSNVKQTHKYQSYCQCHSSQYTVHI